MVNEVNSYSTNGRVYFVSVDYNSITGLTTETFLQKFSIVTLREAKRGSAGVLVAKREAAGDTQSVQEMTM